MTWSSQVAPNVITIFIVNKMPQFRMNDGNIWITIKVTASVWVWIDKDGLC